MNDEPRVWISSKKLKNGKRSYYLRWIDLTTGKWKNKVAGTDRKRVEREAAKLETELRKGTHVDVKNTPWGQFVAEHVATIRKKEHRNNVERTLTGFGIVCAPRGPHAVTYGMIERYVAHLEQHGNPPTKQLDHNHKTKPSAIATINLRLRILRAALGKAVKRGYAPANPMANWDWEKENDPTPRVLDGTEKKRLLDAAPTRQWQAFIYVDMVTGCRLTELLCLAWERVNLQDATILVTKTKGKKDRLMPLTPKAVRTLRSLQAATLKDGGPFIGMGHKRTVQKTFTEIVESAGIAKCTIHNLRDTYCTDLAKAGVNQRIVQELAGHKSMMTTARYYQLVNTDTKRDAVRRLANVG